MDRPQNTREAAADLQAPPLAEITGDATATGASDWLSVVPGKVLFALSNTWVGEVTPEWSQDGGTTVYTLAAAKSDNGSWALDMPVAGSVRFNVTAYTSGTITYYVGQGW